MAQVIRSTKSRSDWSVNELFAYNITVKAVQPEAFFRSGATPSLEHLDPNILTAPAGADGPELSDSTARYLGYLDLATRAMHENFGDDFARETLFLLGFSERNHILSTRFNIPLTICGKTNRSTQPGMCLLYRPTLVLLILAADKTIASHTDPESQVIAKAIAAFQFNNNKRESLGRPPLPSMTISCITMSGTRPTFYLVPVTTELSTAVATGQYPSSKTVVSKCVTVAAHTHRASDGMEGTQYRQLTLQRFLAFRTLAKSHWEEILQDIEAANKRCFDASERDLKLEFTGEPLDSETGMIQRQRTKSAH
ncbi:hypothetical protein B0H17DRAFT_1166630 [Mycena rosella]|uniref:Uncharacterized protein n=1 Tax=Mycena rosella TaxID=1033263 RepID=A0AAD7M8B9_MYCRO|nr:hypothetical protein B0H17DRAFT_1166630 [Mycena rosella]